MKIQEEGSHMQAKGWTSEERKPAEIVKKKKCIDI